MSNRSNKPTARGVAVEHRSSDRSTRRTISSSEAVAFGLPAFAIRLFDRRYLKAEMLHALPKHWHD